MEYINIAKILLHPIPATTQQNVINTLQMHTIEDERRRRRRTKYSAAGTQTIAKTTPRSPCSKKNAFNKAIARHNQLR
jgi:hypothetical protein